MENAVEIIFRRRSTRAYDGRCVERDKNDLLMEHLKAFSSGPFGNSVRFKLAGGGERGFEPGTGLMIQGAADYLAGAVKKGGMAMEDFGYCMEAGILKATELGICTCWIAGTLSRKYFAKIMKLEPGEIIPAVSPLGYPGGRSTLIAGMMGISKGNKNRKNFEDLFFDGDLNTPLLKGDAGRYGEVLEAVRAAPSASNRQPWRIIRDKAGNGSYHFYLSENVLYNNAIKDIKLQNIDMGIAICHFDLAAAELGLKGEIKQENPGIDPGSMTYIASWKVSS
jgi:nitroreductase